MGVQKGPWNMARVLTLKDKELAGRGADGRGGTARQRAQPGRQLGGQKMGPRQGQEGQHHMRPAVPSTRPWCPQNPRPMRPSGACAAGHLPAWGAGVGKDPGTAGPVT